MSKKENDPSVTSFLNVDLDLDVTEGMDELLDALKPATVISRFGTRAGLELNFWPESPEGGIEGFIELVNKLPPHVRTIWDKAKSKTFSIGIQASAKPYATEFVLSNDVLSLIHSVSAKIAFTVYAPLRET